MPKFLTLRMSDGVTFGTGADSDEQVTYIKSHVNHIDGLLDNNNKIRLDLMSSALFGGQKQQGTLGANGILNDLFGSILKTASTYGVEGHFELNQIMKGRFFQVQVLESIIDDSSLTNANAVLKQDYIDFYKTANFPYNYQHLWNGNIIDDGGIIKKLENGDLLVFNGVDEITVDLDESKIPYQITDGADAFAIGDGYGTTGINIVWGNIKAANTALYKVTYDTIRVEVTGIVGALLPPAFVQLKVGTNGEFSVSENTSIYQEGGDWRIIHTFKDVEITFTPTDWALVHLAGTTSADIKVNWGVINNTYNDASTDHKGVIMLASGEEITTQNGVLKAVTPAGAKLAVDTFGLKIATSDDGKTGTDNTKAVTPLVSKEMIDYWSTIPRFATVANANASGLASVNGKVVLVG